MESLPTFIGFRDLFEGMDKSVWEPVNYPPYNIFKIDGTESVQYAIEIAVTGLDKDEIEVTTEKNVLSVKGMRKNIDAGITYIHKSLSTKDFERKFSLSPDVHVVNAGVKNGLLTILLEKIVPEPLQKKTIKIV